MCGSSTQFPFPWLIFLNCPSLFRSFGRPAKEAEAGEAQIQAAVGFQVGRPRQGLVGRLICGMSWCEHVFFVSKFMNNEVQTTNNKQATTSNNKQQQTSNKQQQTTTMNYSLGGTIPIVFCFEFVFFFRSWLWKTQAETSDQVHQKDIGEHILGAVNHGESASENMVDIRFVLAYGAESDGLRFNPAILARISDYSIVNWISSSFIDSSFGTFFSPLSLPRVQQTSRHDGLPKNRPRAGRDMPTWRYSAPPEYTWKRSTIIPMFNDTWKSYGKKWPSFSLSNQTMQIHSLRGQELFIPRPPKKGCCCTFWMPCDDFRKRPGTRCCPSQSKAWFHKRPSCCVPVFLWNLP